MVAEPGSLFVWGGELPGVPLMIDAADGAQVLALGAPVEGGGAPVALLAEEGISWLSSSGEPVSSLVQAGHRAEEAAVVDADSGIAVCRCVVGHSRAQPPARAPAAMRPRPPCPVASLCRKRTPSWTRGWRRGWHKPQKRKQWAADASTC